jgi:hypothetical protein
MKRITLSVGLVALGAAAAHAQYATGLSSVDASKPWSFSGVIRGFYDDNYLTLPKSYPVIVNGGIVYLHPRDSYGTELSPAVYYNHSVESTLLTASFVYDLNWYEDRNSSTFQTFMFNTKLDHEFSERYKMSVTETFVSAQDPGILNPNVVSSPLRVPGSNIRNTSGLDLTAQMTRLLDLHLAYLNNIYAYQQNGGDEAPADSYASQSASLDRIEQSATIDLRWKALPETTAVFSYRYENVDYTSPEDIIFDGSAPYQSYAYYHGPGSYKAESRNNNDHFVYAGVDQSFTPTLNGSIRAGVEYVDYYHQDTSTLSPYVDASLTYQYLPRCAAQFGLKQLHNATDVTGVYGTTPVVDEESTAVYLSVSHAVTARLTAAVLAQAQYSSFTGGGAAYNQAGEDYYTLTVNIGYQFTPWLTGETGYNFSKLDSDLMNRSYTRDVVYVGIRATY